MVVRIALPSKGRMEEETLDFFAACDLRINKINPRQYTASIAGLPEVEVLFQRARDIPRSVASGNVDLGITGYDSIVDVLGDDPPELLMIHEALGYSECALVVAVPDAWGGVETLADLQSYAGEQGGLRVATKHAAAADRFFARRGFTGIEIISADGALEAAPAIGYADLIVDISSTGTTLRENQLKMLADGLVLESQAVFIGNRAALSANESVLTVTARMLELIEANLAANGQYLLFANMRGESAEAIGERIFSQTDLGGLEGPTIAKVISRDMGKNWWAINLVVDRRHLYDAVRQIRAIGGSGVVATPINFIFEENPDRYQRLLAALKTER